MVERMCVGALGARTAYDTFVASEEQLSYTPKC